MGQWGIRAKSGCMHVQHEEEAGKGRNDEEEKKGRVEEIIDDGTQYKDLPVARRRPRPMAAPMAIT